MIRRCVQVCSMLATFCGHANAATPSAIFGAKIASPQMQNLTDQTLPSFFGALAQITETHATDCGAVIRITRGELPIVNSILALARVRDCHGPKQVLALRLTLDGASAQDVRRAMRTSSTTPCQDGAGTAGAPSLVWSDKHRVMGVVQDQSPSTMFSVFFVNLDQHDSADPDAEEALRRALLADLPPACR